MALAMLRMWMSMGSSFGALGLTATFPSGRPQSTAERAVLWTAGIWALLLPLLNALSLAHARAGTVCRPGRASGEQRVVRRGNGGMGTGHGDAVPALPDVGARRLGSALQSATGTGGRTDRLRIRWLFGWVAAAPIVALQMTVLWTAGPQSSLGWAVSFLLWPVVLVLAVGSLVVALFAEGVFGIDEPSRRRLTRRALRVILGICAVAVAVGLGLIAGRLGGTSLAVIVSVAVALSARPVWRALEGALDRWLFGARLDGYDMLARFGTSLNTSPSPAGLATGLAEALHRRPRPERGCRVTLDGALHARGDRGHGDRAGRGGSTLAHAGQDLGRIECGTRHDGSLLDEDLRLLGIVAAQAAAAASTLRLTAELADRVELIRVQAAELAASRQRVVSGQDAERRRIQQDLHDGVQQEIVALSAKVSLAQQQLRRGDPAAADALAELQRDLRGVLADVREVAYAIHPPILSDRGLVEAVEGQAGRLVVPTVVHADRTLRQARFDERIESAAWYALAEAMSNVVKHARRRALRRGARPPRTAGCCSACAMTDAASIRAGPAGSG